MPKQFLEGYRRYRLMLLLVALACSAIFYGNSCDCSCSVDPYYIKYGDEHGEIWVEENLPSVHPLKLLASNKDVTVSNVTWSVLSAPSSSIIKPGGYEITPAAGQEVTLKLSPQESFEGAEMRTITYRNALIAIMRVRADFLSSVEPGPKALEEEVTIWAMQPSLVAYGITGNPYLDKGNPISGKRSTVDCVFDYQVSTETAVLKVVVYYGGGGKPYQFSAKVGSSNRQYLTVSRIEIVDPQAADIHLSFSRGVPPPGNPETFCFPLLLKADGAKGHSAMDIVDICLSR